MKRLKPEYKNVFEEICKSYKDPKFKLTCIGKLKDGQRFFLPIYQLECPIRPGPLMQKISTEKDDTCTAVKLIALEGKLTKPQHSKWNYYYPVFIARNM
jgi:hypothetical protein